MKLTLPNLLTTLRLISTIPLIFFILTNNTQATLITFFLALLTELDGTVARRLNQTTKFGTMYDPIVDGIFSAGGIVALLLVSKVSILLIALLILVNVPRMVFLKVFLKESSKASKFSGLLIFFIIPLAILDFVYLSHFLLFTIFFTLALMLQRVLGYLKKRKANSH